MLSEILRQEILKHGENSELATRLLAYGEKPLVAWLANRLVDTSSNSIEAMERFGRQIGKPLHVVRYAIYTMHCIPLSEMEDCETVARIKELLHGVYDIPLVLDIYRYAPLHVKSLAMVEALRSKVFTPLQVSELFKVSRDTVYRAMNVAESRGFYVYPNRHKDDNQHN